MARPWNIDRLRRFAARPVVRIVAVSMPAVLTAGLLVGIPALAQTGFTPPPLQRVPSVPVKAVHGIGATPDPAVAAAKRTHPAAQWPAAGTADVSMTAAPGSPAAATRTPVRAGTLPVYLAPASGTGTNAPAVAGTAPSRVHVELLDQGQSAKAHRHGVLLRLARADGSAGAGRVSVGLDYAAIRDAYGADWATRLRLVALPECALSTPDSPACQGVPLPSHNDAGHARVSADVTLPGTPGGSAQALTTNAVLLAATSGPSGTAGDFSATPLAPSSTWQAGGSSGDFEWSYPMRVPQSLGGPAPGVALSYSSQSVDGRTQASNNQPSVVGEGFDLATAGFIERRYKSCGDDMGGTANNTTKTGDECWGTDNATLSMGGHSGELIYNSGDGTWHLRHDDGIRVVRLTGTSNGSYDGEYWRVTTVDG